MSFIPYSNTSTECMDSLGKVRKGLTVSPYEEYAMRMLDANGKFSSGILQGNVHALGDFNECISIMGDGFIGTFMTAQLPLLLQMDDQFDSINELSKLLPKVTPATLYKRHMDYNMDWGLLGIKDDDYWIQDLILATTLQPVYFGLCMPSTCRAQEVEKSLEELLNHAISVATNEGVTKFPRKYVIGDFVYNEEIFSSSHYYKWNIGDYIAIALIVLAFSLGLIGSFLDYFVPKSRNIFIRLIICFSFYTNAQKIMAPPTNNSISSIFGIKSISMIWVVLAHSYYLALFLTSNMNHFDYLDIYFEIPFLILLSAELAVDTFFTIGGFLMAYLFLKFLDKSKGKFNPLALYLHRYIRLTPTYAILILVFHTLPLKMSFGPFRKFADDLVDRCDNNWWTNLLYINNFINANKNCMGESWYLAVDFQLYLISPFIVWALWKGKKIGGIVFSIAMVLSAAVPAAVTAINEYPFMVTFSIKDPDWTTGFYTKSWNRTGPYFIGLLFGFLLYKMDKNEIHFKLKKVFVLVGWTLSTAIALTLIFGLYYIWPIDLQCYYSRCFSVVASTFYSAFARTAWGVMICWVIFVCIKGYGGLVNSFLSSHLWAPISRISYIMYLTHVHIQTYFYASRKQTFHFDQALMIYWFFGHIMITMMFSFIISLLFESPFIGIEKIIFGRGGDKKSNPKENEILPKNTNTTDPGEIKKQRNLALNNVSQQPSCQVDNGDLPQNNHSKTDLTNIEN
ncbi:unnamed protein product [Lepeophtheirus salmonis]|uniref:(salmon louse) hypothetical protein n=1 Tax=Lepeophtheirus salmonis TaxID=72036 RepID=A0A7R8CPY6_LEPSM|nr:unnamed protein product [Lepeophtheirus salmonis]CAF2843617.1 unnamed protein product [Lepeophtheirus salmonis]